MTFACEISNISRFYDVNVTPDPEFLETIRWRRTVNNCRSRFCLLISFCLGISSCQNAAKCLSGLLSVKEWQGESAPNTFIYT